MKRNTTIRTKASIKAFKEENLKNTTTFSKSSKTLPKIQFIATYPPRECGIATYTYDLKNTLENKFDRCFDIKICAVESNTENHNYTTEDVNMVLNTDNQESFKKIAEKINSDKGTKIVMIQHEFGLFKNNEETFIDFLKSLTKPIIIAFHTVLPHPNKDLEKNVKDLVALAKMVTVMTQSSSDLLSQTYGVPLDKIKIIPHGTHLVKHQEKSFLKEKYNVSDRKVISTFGFLGPGKSIETTLDALPEIIKEHPTIMFFIVGKTHPTLFNSEGDAYKDFLQQKVTALQLENHVSFINKFVPLSELLEYLQLSDCYVFTSKDPNQAVSGTFSYAVSCGCPIISTPIPHAKEVLQLGNGVLFDFGNSEQLAQKVKELLNDDALRQDMKMKGLHTSAATSWENSAISHAHLFSELMKKTFRLKYKKPLINLSHLQAMTTEVGVIQFSKINTPDINSGYTLDDNARALIAACDHYKITQREEDVKLIETYANFILKCQRDNGLFLNYVDKDKKFTKQNEDENLEDANGRAIWALGYTYYLMEEDLDLDATLLQNILFAITQFNLKIHLFKSPRALAFTIKGLYFFNVKLNNTKITGIINDLASKLVDLYNFHSEENWNWFENYLTYANSVLPESLLYAWKATGELKFKAIAKETFDFLLSKIFQEDSIRVISNQSWLIKGFDEKLVLNGGEQPIDVAYTILALKQFHQAFPAEGYDDKMEIAFSWFQGNNQLKQIIYNPCTGGCHDGLESYNVNLNQGAESTISYCLARFAFEDIV
ncbi:Glycosyltransferase involved in cell wall bisynthesis [Flavobacterium flevense]|uniref:Glycosyl transferase n=1 Tax=Flavobacterium flevense TaxID=983 RepID=A0A4Y4B214_9FLAO|nr:glycosyltransferase [Flavobacterium flevense]GEC73290.1 glycosyl transferase [Flavobacterium flevense]SHM17665.1 Glycosyltransferase involved in cell wall bisynthesis [Flavobacterium flevense]